MNGLRVASTVQYTTAFIAPFLCYFSPYKCSLDDMPLLKVTRKHTCTKCVVCVFAGVLSVWVADKISSLVNTATTV